MPADKKLYEVATPAVQYNFRVNIFMWPNRTLFLGPLDHLALHSMGSIAINVGLYQPFLMRTADGDYKKYRCAIIPAGLNHEIQAFGNVVASLTIERNSQDFSNLMQRFSFQSDRLTNVLADEWITCLQKVYEEKPSKQETDLLLSQLLSVTDVSNERLDPRIENIMQTIHAQPDNQHKQSYLAASQGLSSSRFRHLFKEQLNVPYRQYRVWMKVLAALNNFNKVDNLTQVAMDTGFTDSAHLNRCFRHTLGANPSQIFKCVDRFEV